ncbi:uncharacterized protein [Anabrus simplex]|uniref:uncharacterized protein n=1 Tax=Anabrus simplex TaxID=316456 RepID=UPI0035A38311
MAEGGENVLPSWEARATDMQQKFFNSFGEFDWDLYQSSEMISLERKVGFALFGPPSELPFTITERITCALLEGDKKTFLLFFQDDDWEILRSSALRFSETLVVSTLFTSCNEVSNYEALKEYDVIKTICSFLISGEKEKFLNYFSEDFWNFFQKSLNDFIEEQVKDTLFGCAENQSVYTYKQIDIINRIYYIVRSGDLQKFCHYLPESKLFSIESTALEFLHEKVGRSLFGFKIFSYSENQKKMIEKVSIAILRDDEATFLHFLGIREWNEFQESIGKLLRENIGKCLFGCPGEPPPKKNTNQTGYPSKQYETIKKLCSVIQKEDKHERSENGEIYMSIIFLCLEVVGKESSDVLPVAIFRVPNGPNGSFFIDSSSRVYKDWDDFLENNVLPKCRYCFPRHGIYQADDEGFVLVDFGKTPASKVSNKVLTVMDVANAGVCLGTTAISIASLFVPVAGPFIATSVVAGSTAGMYGVFRSSKTLVDRAQHNQSIELTDSEARSCWISLAGSVIGTASMGATTALTRMAQTGQVVGRTTRIATTVLNIGSLVINGLGVIHGAFMLHSKYNDGELTALDVFQFSASVLFFTHSVVNMKTADTIIRETQNDVIQKYEANLRSNRHRKMFRKVARNTQKDMGAVEGRAKVIRSLRTIENKDDFFAGLVRSDKDFRKTGSKVKFTENGLVEINSQFKIDPMKFAQISRDQRQIILKATQNLANGNLSHQDFIARTDAIFTQHNISLTVSERNECVSNITGILVGNSFAGISSDGQRVLQLTMLYEMADVCKILMNVDKKLHLRLLEAAVRLSEILGWTNESNFVKVLNFVLRTVYNIASKMEEKYQEDLQWSKCEKGSDFDQDEFDRNYKISGKRFDHFCSVVLEQFVSEPLILDSLKAAFQLGRDFNYGTDNVKDKTEDSSILQSAVETEKVLQYSGNGTFTKARPFWVNGSLKTLSEDEIFDIVQEVTGFLVDATNCFIDFEGMHANATAKSPDGGATYVVIRCNVEEDTVTAQPYAVD